MPTADCAACTNSNFQTPAWNGTKYCGFVWGGTVPANITSNCCTGPFDTARADMFAILPCVDSFAIFGVRNGRLVRAVCAAVQRSFGSGWWGRYKVQSASGQYGFERGFCYGQRFGEEQWSTAGC